MDKVVNTWCGVVVVALMVKARGGVGGGRASSACLRDVSYCLMVGEGEGGGWWGGGGEEDWGRRKGRLWPSRLYCLWSNHFLYIMPCINELTNSFLTSWWLQYKYFNSPPPPPPPPSLPSHGDTNKDSSVVLQQFLRRHIVDWCMCSSN